MEQTEQGRLRELAQNVYDAEAPGLRLGNGHAMYTMRYYFLMAVRTKDITRIRQGCEQVLYAAEDARLRARLETMYRQVVGDS